MDPRALEAIRSFRMPPRTWQSEALRCWIDAGLRGTVSVVTGGGKTFFAFLCMQAFARRTSSPRFLVIVPSIALLDQWMYSLEHELGVPRSEIWVPSPTDDGPRGSVGVAVINTARNIPKRLTAEGEWFLCVDECHRAGSPVNARALRLTARATLGLSATPVRQYDRGFEESVAPKIGPVVFEYSFAQGVRDAVVTPFQLENYRIPLFDEEKKRVDRLTGLIAREWSRVRRAGDSHSAELERLLRQRSGVLIAARWRVPAAARLALDASHPTIVFHERIAAAKEIERLVESNGRRAVIYHSQISQGMRQRNLALFREGIVDVLVACRSLDEGLNVPEAGVGILAASTRSTRQRIQRMGRIIRRSPGKDVARVCTLYASSPEERHLREESADLPEVVKVLWQRLSPGDD